MLVAELVFVLVVLLAEKLVDRLDGLLEWQIYNCKCKCD